MGSFLGVSSLEVQRIKQDLLNAMLKQIMAVLDKWNVRKSENANFGRLFKAIKEAPCDYVSWYTLEEKYECI